MKHDPKAIRNGVKRVGDKLIALKDTDIHVPLFFKSKGLYKVKGDGVQVFGSYAMVQGDKYSRSAVACHASITPSRVIKKEIDGMEYNILQIDKGQPILDTFKSIQKKLEVFDLMTQFLLRGKMPWYHDYESFIKVFAKSGKYAGVDVFANPETFEAMLAMGARMPNNQDAFIRQAGIKNPASDKMQIVPLSNVHFGAATTLAKITGSYQGAGLKSAIVTNTTKMAPLEKILRDK